MTPQEREEALQLVDDLQKDRSGALLGNISAERVPHILLPYQVRWHLDESIVRICSKGRRVGFTWGAWAAEAALEAARASGGMNQFYMGYNQGMAAEFIGDCATFARWYGQICSEIDVGYEKVVIDDEKHDIVTYKIAFANGRKIEALSAMPHNWRGRQGHARIDEAGHHMRLEAVVDGALAYRIWGGRISIGGTMNGEDNAFTDYVKRCKEGKLNWSHHEVKFSDAVLEGLYRRICLVTKKVWSADAEIAFVAEIRKQYPSVESADEELECIPKRGSGVYFSRMLLEARAAKEPLVLHYTKPAHFVLDSERIAVTQQWIDEVLKPVVDAMPKRRSVFGQDFGRTGDLSVITVGQSEAVGRAMRTPFRLELRSIPFDCQELIVEWLMANLPLFDKSKFDARGNGQSHAEKAMQKAGAAKVECVMLSGPWYDEWFAKYHQAFEDGEIVTFGDEDWIADHRSVVLIGGRPRVSDLRVKGSDGHDRHGDSAVSGVLCWAAFRSEGQPAAGTEVENTPDTYVPEAGRTRLMGGFGHRPETGPERRRWGALR